MKNFLSKLWSSMGNLQSSDVSLDRRLTVGSPSGLTINWTLKLVSVLVLVLTVGVGNAWADSQSFNKDDFSSSTSSTKTPITVTFSAKSISGQQIRFNSGATVTFTSSSGNITGIAVSTNSTNQYIKNMGATVSSGTWSGSGTSYSWSGNASSITMTAGAACRITTMTVTYSAASCTQNPTVTAGSNSSVTSTTATVSCSGISVLGSAGCTISGYGFVIGGSANPSIGGSGVTQYEVGTSYTTVNTSFSKNLIGLSAETTYYVRPYATNGNGTAYGTQTSFTTSALPKYTISFETGTGNPTQADITETVAGAGITLPAGPTPTCSGDGWSFAGWGYESCNDESTEPTLYIAGNKYYPSSNETLYAVYVKGKTASTNYKLISDAAQIVSGENYVIAAYYNSNDYAITAEIQSSYYIKQTAVTVTAENVISIPGANIIWQLTNEGGSNVSLYNSNQKKYLYVYASGSYRNLGLYDSKKQFTMTEEREAGYASTFAFNSTDYTSYYINYDATHTDFGTKTSSDENLYLYKRQYTGTYESNPTCCDKEVTLAHNSPSNGTVSFAPAGPIETCDGTVNTTMTITPAAGYTLTAFNYSAGSGTVSPSSQSPSAPSTTANSASPQVITLTFAQDANGTCTANATFSAIAPTAWSWTYNSAAIPNPINLYIGQTAALVATYTPSGLLNSEKDYDITKSSGLTQVSKTYAVEHPTYTFRADVVMDDGTIVLTNHNHTSLTTTVHVHVAPLPLVHFVDIVHSYEFADVVGTIEDNVLVANKTTPTHAEYSGTGANDCETDHTRLVGWIEKTWADAHPDATHSDIIGAGTGVFIEANAAINVLTYNGNTYYAVWAKLE